ncbi:MAG: hypothetical protein DMG11_01895 [Acidobacteria bacterium]|nr:MAG: hypothetical protein DMG11_01895 [Acidobacteriota bacterium]
MRERRSLFERTVCSSPAATAKACAKLSYIRARYASWQGPLRTGSFELIELPAGTLQDGEDPRECAIRELEEETGYRAGTMTERARFFTTPGFTTELMYLYEASGLVKTQMNPDDDEVIEVDIVPCPDALRMIDDGRIQDAKSILGLLMILK